MSQHPKSPQNLPQRHFKGGHFNHRLQTHIKGHCGFCESDHIEHFSTCPKLEEIKTGKSELPNSLCSKCLKPKLPGNEKHINCNIYYHKNSGKTVNTQCSQHKFHYKICRKCPDNEYNPTQSWTRKKPFVKNQLHPIFALVKIHWLFLLPHYTPCTPCENSFIL